MHYLGFLVGIDGVQPLSEKVAAIQAIQPPKHIDELRQFLGLVGFYRKFIPFFADVTLCLNKMLRKGVTFNWTTQCKNAFKLLKSKLVRIQAFHYPNPNKLFKLFTDTSKHSFPWVLHQEKSYYVPGTEASLIPIAYFSGSFSRTQQLWNTTKKECYAVYQSVQKFAFHLAGTECTLCCDHKPIAISTILHYWYVYILVDNVRTLPRQ